MWSVFDVSKQEQDILRIEQEAGVSGFWDDYQNAQNVMQELGRLKETVSVWRGLQRDVESTLDLVSLSIEEQDNSFQSQLEADVSRLNRIMSQQEVVLTLSGEYDDRPAILTIYAGAGGTDSQDWAEMLFRMYARWAEDDKRPSQIMDLSYGDEAGVRGATIEIGGRYSYGYLSAEKGVHRLVRLSPYDPNHLRHTSFAQVEVLPAALDEEVNISVRQEDIKMDTFRSSGPGGQNVQKVASAVRLTHIPTGIVVSCQTERSQHQNREYAMRILNARILDMENKKRSEERSKLLGDRVSAEWGNQIRSYVLHPYKSVKDHRTNHQSTNPEAVLDGRISGFIEAYLMSKVG